MNKGVSIFIYQRKQTLMNNPTPPTPTSGKSPIGRPRSVGLGASLDDPDRCTLTASFTRDTIDVAGAPLDLCLDDRRWLE